MSGDETPVVIPPEALATVRHDIMLALDEQVSESLGHIGEPSYNAHDLRQNAQWFGTVRDWLNDNWDEIFGVTS